MRAHRYALSLIHENLTDLHALHRCDNTLCVKATAQADTHLTAGTRAENMADRSRRGRSNFQGRPTKSKTDRAEAARTLREITLKDGYKQQAVDELMKGIPAEQLSLFLERMVALPMRVEPPFFLSIPQYLNGNLSCHS